MTKHTAGGAVQQQGLCSLLGCFLDEEGPQDAGPHRGREGQHQRLMQGQVHHSKQVVYNGAKAKDAAHKQKPPPAHASAIGPSHRQAGLTNWSTDTHGPRYEWSFDCGSCFDSSQTRGLFFKGIWTSTTYFLPLAQYLKAIGILTVKQMARAPSYNCLILAIVYKIITLGQTCKLQCNCVACS